MNLANETKQQHFISAYEQGLNSLNPNALKRSNKKIYSFTLKDRQSQSFKLDNEKGTSIDSSLSAFDLYSFDMIDKNIRLNFEDLFKKYESLLEVNTTALLSKILKKDNNVKDEIYYLFFIKFLNFIRNPYCINKVFNTFPYLKSLQPTNPLHLKYYEKILNGINYSQAFNCKKFDISTEDYRDWLALLFNLLIPHGKDNKVIFEDIVRDLYVNESSFIMVNAFYYTNHSCLLSDRGFSTPIESDEYLSFDFNLCSNVFLRYTFADIYTVAPKNASSKIIDLYKKMPKKIIYKVEVDNLEALIKYNQNVVFQCHAKFFNSTIDCYGL